MAGLAVLLALFEGGSAQIPYAVVAWTIVLPPGGAYLLALLAARLVRRALARM